MQHRVVGALATILIATVTLSWGATGPTGASAVAQSPRTATGRAAASARAVPTSGGLLSTHTLAGGRSRHVGNIDVWTPPGYRASSHRTWPVLVALHGWPGSPGFMETHTGVLEQVSAAARHRHMAWPIVVVPQWGSGIDTECTDGAASQQIETWLTADLPRWLEQNYRVRTGPQNWAGFGYSAGAWCSRMLTMRHADLLGADIDLSGYSEPWFEPAYVPFTPGSVQGRRYDLLALERHHAPRASFYLVSSPGDGESYPSTLAFRRAARTPMRVTWVPARGGHSMALWGPQMPLAFAWLGRTLGGFRP